MKQAFLTLGVFALVAGESIAEVNRPADSMYFSIHVDIAAQLDLDELREHLRSVRSWVESSRGPDDISCCTEIQAIDLQIFGTPGDGLDVIDSEAKYNLISSLHAFVQDIAWCGGPTSACGCGRIGDDGFLVSVSDNCFVPYVIAHERLHNAGQVHGTGDPCTFMDSGAICLTTYECSNFRSLALASTGGVCGCLGPSVGNPPLPDGTSCNQEVPGGSCGWSGLCLEGDVESSFDGPTPLNTNAAIDSGNDLFSALATADGSWIALWSSYDPLDSAIGTDLDILIARSSDAGATWTPPLALNTNAASDLGNDWYPKLAGDGQGAWVAVWFSDETLGDTIGDDYDILVSSSTDDGASWSSPVALNSTAGGLGEGNWYPDVTTDGQGTWIAVWGSSDSLGDTIGTDQDILIARSLDKGLSWTPASPLNTNAATDESNDWYPQLRTDALGTWVAVWHSIDSLGNTIGTDRDILVARSLDAGITWSPPVPLNTTAETDTGEDRTPQLATDGQGSWIAVWPSTEDLGDSIGSDYDILMARSLDGGVTWTPPTPVNTNAATDSRDDLVAQLAVSSQGNWVVVWASEDTLGGTIGTDSDILVARSSDGGVTWSPPEPANANAVADAYPDFRPQVAIDTLGRQVLMWQSYDALGDYLGGSIGKDYDILTALPEPGGLLHLLIGAATLSFLLRVNMQRRAR